MNFKRIGLPFWVSIIKLKLVLTLVIGEECLGFRVRGRVYLNTWILSCVVVF